MATGRVQTRPVAATISVCEEHTDAPCVGIVFPGVRLHLGAG